MACSVLLTLLVLTISKAAEAVDHQCPVAGSASGMADFQQVTTVDYCVVDDCTIMRTDSGEELDIVYTTDSLLVVTPKGNQPRHCTNIL